MSKHQSQHDFIVSELKQNGKISRNFALNLYHLGIRPSITKLATLISTLRLKEGWNIEPKDELDANGNKDMVYYVKQIPQSALTKKAIIKDGRAYLSYV